MRRMLAAVLAAGMLAAACSGDSGDEDAAPDPAESSESASASAPSESADAQGDGTDVTTSTVVVDDGPKAPFTGLSADEALLTQPAVVVKISNNNDDSVAALVGIDAADIVIEERIEDRATRFAAIFHSAVPDTVGPVRSARTTDLDLLRNLGKPILVFSGANVSTLRELRELALAEEAVLVVDDGSGTYHVRDTDFRAPDNLFSDISLVRDDFAGDADAAAGIFAFRDAASDTRPASVDGSGVTVTGRDDVSFVHDPARGYVRVQDGEIHATRDGVALVVTNLVVMETQYVTNANDPSSVDAITIGSGPASVLIGGRRFLGTWSRADAAAPYALATTDGAVIVLEPGSTWVTLVPEGTYEFGVDAETQGLVLGGDE